MDKYWRQHAEYAMKDHRVPVEDMKVLILGVADVGVEVAKNVVVAGVHSVTLIDDNLVEIGHLGSNFLLQEEHIGSRTLAEASADGLKELERKTGVDVREMPDDGIPSGDMVLHHTVVVDCCLPLKKAIELNNICRETRTAYLKSRVHGLFGYVFNDFGSRWTSSNPTGEAPHQIGRAHV